MSRPYRGQAADARSADRRARLLQAAVDLVGTKGVSAMTMRAVCREAELSQKFFYESFTDTDDLLYAVYRSTFEHTRRIISAADDPAADLPARARAGVRAAAQLVTDDPRICRILLVEPIADVRLRKFVRESIGSMTLAGVTVPIGGAETKTSARVKMQYATVFGAIISLFIEWTEGNLGSDQEVFVDHVATMLLASPLFGSQAVPSAGHPARTPRINRSS
ncbi:TetR family transcriptional regulator [Mycolicibacterium sp. 050232]|uniref:TetR/AcrR family transcriptional regulator n=1 Tax=Mycolicibacterium sp. 050232 TaxID=3113982 RepID=UPI002E2CBCEA|nr:TetR family transcriptional regulator [Mycolicibacterium sp. 050232]MED5811299.1 TetR family transcriptional regulator [Mycolicibacterium sp. 050232]